MKSFDKHVAEGFKERQVLSKVSNFEEVTTTGSEGFRGVATFVTGVRIEFMKM